MTKIRSHSFDVDDAVKHGVEAAVIISNLRYWIDRNKANKKNQRDGYYWTYNTGEAFAYLFPYWSRQKISRILRALEESKVIISGTYNNDCRDRTKWYTLPEFKIEQETDNSHCSDLNNGMLKDEHSIHCSDLNNVSLSNSKPDSKQETIVQNNLHDDSIKNVLGHLSEKTGIKFGTGKTNATPVRARLEEGYSLEDLIAVINVKCLEWLHQPKMCQFLRPSTLFSASKFGGYLIQASKTLTPDAAEEQRRGSAVVESLKSKQKNASWMKDNKS